MRAWVRRTNRIARAAVVMTTPSSLSDMAIEDPTVPVSTSDPTGQRALAAVIRHAFPKKGATDGE